MSIWQHRGKTSGHASILPVVGRVDTCPGKNPTKIEWLHCVSSKPYFERINKHCILQTKNINGQKVQEVSTTTWSLRWVLLNLSSKTFCLLNKKWQFANFHLRYVLLKKSMSLDTRTFRVHSNWNLGYILQSKWIKKLNFSRVFLTFRFKLLLWTIPQDIFWSHPVENRKINTNATSFDT